MRARYLTDEEISRLAGVSPSLWLPFIVGAQTGLRIGDVLKIRPADIYCGGVRYVAQKTGKGGRAALDTDTLCALLSSAKGAPWCFPSPRSYATPDATSGMVAGEVGVQAGGRRPARRFAALLPQGFRGRLAP